MGLILIAAFAFCLTSALQVLVPTRMPFGTTGDSEALAAVEQRLSLIPVTYANQSDATQALQRGEIYGALIPGTSGDTLLLAPAKSFFAAVELQAAFEALDRPSGSALVVQDVVPLPQRDRLGTVAGLLLLPTLVGGYLVASLLMSATAMPARRRIALLLGFSAVGAVLVDVIAGPLIGAVSGDHFWPLLLCLFLVTAAVSLASAAIQGLAGKLGTAIVVLVFIVVGGASAGGVGVSLLPGLWQDIGILLPPRSAVELFRNVLYFGASDIVVPAVILGVYALAGAGVLLILQRARAAALPSVSAPDSESAPASPARRSEAAKVTFAVGLATVMLSLFALNYISSGHEPVARDMPIGVTGPSALVDQVQTQYPLVVSQYPDEAAAKAAIDRTEIWAAVIPGETASELIVVPSISDIAPLDLGIQFRQAAAALGQTVTIRQYLPVPLAPNDPIGLVSSLLLTSLLVGGYVGAALLASTAGAAGRGHSLILLGFAVVAGLMVDLIVTVLLQGLPMASFWVAWPIMSLIVLVVALMAAVLRRLVGPIGILLTVIIVLQFGNPSSGGANGVPYLTDFWSTIGPFLPPRNAYLLLRNSVYFEGNAIGQALAVLLIYVAVFGVALFLLNRRSNPGVGLVDDDEGQAAAAGSAPVGAPI